jgi:CRP/FNR family cyclic AMP-dependent transcriptional regulator
MSDSGIKGSGSVLAATATAAADVNELLQEPSLGARQIEATTGTALIEPTTPAQHVYFIHTGQVRVYQTGPENSARLLEILGPGDWFGVPALAGAETYGTRAVAVSAVTVSEVPAEKWLALLNQNPAVATQWVARLAGKLVRASEDAACLVFDDCNQRLIKTLLQFSRTAAATPHPEGVVLRITHQQLAQAVGAARETISLALTQLRQQKLLRTGRNQLFFDPAVLQKFSQRAGAAEELVDERVA